jgi:hypothetical protein
MLGAVEDVNSYLSADETTVYTDYRITPIQIIRQRQAVLTGLPGAPTSIVLSRWGGRIIVDGVPVTFTEVDAPAFGLGEQLVFLLKYDNKVDRFKMVDEMAGALRVVSGLIESPVPHESYDRIKGMTIAQLQQEVQRLGR